LVPGDWFYEEGPYLEDEPLFNGLTQNNFWTHGDENISFNDPTVFPGLKDGVGLSEYTDSTNNAYRKSLLRDALPPPNRNYLVSPPETDLGYKWVYYYMVRPHYYNTVERLVNIHNTLIAEGWTVRYAEFTGGKYRGQDVALYYKWVGPGDYYWTSWDVTRYSLVYRPFV
jgi:hypothetical protein